MKTDKNGKRTLILMSCKVFIAIIILMIASPSFAITPSALYLLSDSEYPCKAITLQGIIKKVSTIPDPKKNDYPNAMYCVELEVWNYGGTEQLKINEKIVLVLPVLDNYKLLVENVLPVDCNVEVMVIPYEGVPERIKRIQISDDIQVFEYEYYFVCGLKKDIKLAARSSTFAPVAIRIPAIERLPVDATSARRRRERIDGELGRIAGELQAHGGSFLAWQKQFNQYARYYAPLRDQKYSAWLNGSFFYATNAEPHRNTEESRQRFVKSIAEYNEYLKLNNIDLILLRVPAKADLALTVLNQQPIYVDNPFWLNLYYDLLQNDIEVVDPLPAMWEGRFKYPLQYFFHREEEGHPFFGASMIAARTLSTVLERYLPQSAAFTKNCKLIETKYPDNKKKDRGNWPEGNPSYDPNEKMSFLRTVLEDNSKLVIEQQIKSPFIFCSNSFGAYPDAMQGATIPHYTAYFTKIIPAWFYQDGIGNDMLKNLIARPELLSSRRALIMVMHPGMWSQEVPSMPTFIRKGYNEIEHVKTYYPGMEEIVLQEDGARFIKTAHNTLEMRANGKDRQGRIIFTIDHEDMKNAYILKVFFAEHRLLWCRGENQDGVVDSRQTANEMKRKDNLSISFPAGSKKFSLAFSGLSGQKIEISHIELWRCTKN